MTCLTEKYERAKALIWNCIAPRAAHQQSVENDLVQTSRHLRKTHMEEVRRSAKAKIHSIFYRDFKIWALDLMQKEDEKKRKDQEVDEEWMQAERGRGQQTAP